MTETIQISGELTPDPTVCLFHVDRPIVKDWTVVFRSADESRGSPLVDHLFSVEGVERVMVRDSTITVTKNVPTPWPHLAGEIAKAIRAGLNSGSPPIAQVVIDELAGAPVEGMEEAIAELFEEQINPALAAHGGFVKLVKIEDRDVYLEMGGGCQGCAASRATLRYGVEGAIRRIAPNVRNIIDVTDHAAGVNPYYK